MDMVKEFADTLKKYIDNKINEALENRGIINPLTEDQVRDIACDVVENATYDIEIDTPSISVTT